MYEKVLTIIKHRAVPWVILALLVIPYLIRWLSSYMGQVTWQVVLDILGHPAWQGVGALISIPMLLEWLWYKFRPAQESVQEKKKEIPPPPTPDALDETQTQSQIKFVGRQDEISKVINILTNPSDSKIVAITGLGGIGKTALARMIMTMLIPDPFFINSVWMSAKQDIVL